LFQLYVQAKLSEAWDFIIIVAKIELAKRKGFAVILYFEVKVDFEKRRES